MSIINKKAIAKIKAAVQVIKKKKVSNAAGISDGTLSASCSQSKESDGATTNVGSSALGTSEVIMKEEIFIKEEIIDGGYETNCAMSSTNEEYEIQDSIVKTEWPSDDSNEPLIGLLRGVKDVVVKTENEDFNLDGRRWKTLSEISYTYKGEAPRHPKRYPCEHMTDTGPCDEVFSCITSLRKHIRTHLKKKGCVHCGRIFVRHSYLLNHLRTHTGHLPFRCDVCNRGFPSNDKLKVHLRNHAGGKRFQCKKCYKSYDYKASLRNHLSTHAKNPAWRCEKCLRVFVCGKALENHMLNKICIATDTGNRCEKCNFSFSTKGHLSAHLLAHDRERKHRCPHCVRSYYREDLLRTHVKITHLLEYD